MLWMVMMLESVKAWLWHGFFDRRHWIANGDPPVFVAGGPPTPRALLYQGL